VHSTGCASKQPACCCTRDAARTRSPDSPHPCPLLQGAPIPEHPYPGQKWKEVRHDRTVTWLAFWKDTVNPSQYKYVWLGANSTFKADSDLAKYEKVGGAGLGGAGACLQKLQCVCGGWRVSLGVLVASPVHWRCVCGLEACCGQHVHGIMAPRPGAWDHGTQARCMGSWHPVLCSHSCLSHHLAPS
jgi:hypothetical protein